jgi:putative nucleotidyltransferase with HDIG domain
MDDSSITYSIQNQFRDLNSLLSVVMESISKGGGEAGVLSGNVTHISKLLKLLEQKVNLNFQMHQNQFGALIGVGHTINSSLGLKSVLEEVMDALIRLMQAERGFLMLRELGGELVVRIARGMDRVDLDKEEFSFSRTIIDQVVNSGEPVLTTNATGDPRFEKQMSVTAFQLRSILCTPLKQKNELIGVIYVDHRGMPGLFHSSDLRLISAFADQAAVAIDNARLFETLRDTNIELETAYDATLRGWVRALDMRDNETENHTRRVTALTERLAKMMGFSDKELVHISRGALLHDVGKMGIPDGILRKPGGLSPDERTIIEQHPDLAYEMLSPIQFLHPAIDIPYCHHEKWDGTGYPRKLKGKAIPFSARMFSVVDVWDALASDRPYRKALHPDEIRQYIRAQSELHFDPHVVDAFLALMDLEELLHQNP